MNIIEKAVQLAGEGGHQLLFLTKFGSHLYGTDTPESDADYMGIFLPSKHSIVTCTAPKQLSFKTHKGDGRNGKEDIDLSLWSLQYWLLNLVRKGETNALDLLFSPSHEECVLHKSFVMDQIFDSPLLLFQPRDANAYVGYAIGQAKKYGIKGSRMGVLKSVMDWLEQSKLWFAEERLVGQIEHILSNCHEPSLCFSKEVNGEPSLVLLGKVHMGTITMGEFFARVKRDYERYGARANAAMRGEGIDWKAISHAMRAIYQMEQLLTYGEIEFPLTEAPILRDIKAGLFSWQAAEDMINSGLERVEYLRSKAMIGPYDPNIAPAIIEELYFKC